MTYTWDFHPMLNSHTLNGPPTTNRDNTVHARINGAAGRTYWACHGADKPVRFDDLNEAKAYLLAVVSLS